MSKPADLCHIERIHINDPIEEPMNPALPSVTLSQIEIINAKKLKEINDAAIRYAISRGLMANLDIFAEEEREKFLENFRRVMPD